MVLEGYDDDIRPSAPRKFLQHHQEKGEHFTRGDGDADEGFWITFSSVGIRRGLKTLIDGIDGIELAQLPKFSFTIFQ